MRMTALRKFIFLVKSLIMSFAVLFRVDANRKSMWTFFRFHRKVHEWWNWYFTCKTGWRSPENIKPPMDNSSTPKISKGKVKFYLGQQKYVGTVTPPPHRVVKHLLWNFKGAQVIYWSITCCINAFFLFSNMLSIFTFAQNS